MGAQLHFRVVFLGVLAGCRGACRCSNDATRLNFLDLITFSQFHKLFPSFPRQERLGHAGLK